MVTRASHWVWLVAFFVLVGSGLQIFNASPNLDASDKSDPARRVLAIGSPGRGIGTTTRLFGPHVRHDGLAGLDARRHGLARAARAFGAWVTIPGYQDLAGGRRWHLFFAWVGAVCWLAWLISTAIKGKPARHGAAPERSSETLADAGVLFETA